MITLDISNVSQDKVGAEHGLDMPAVFAEYGERMAAAVKTLYATQNEEGGWKKWLGLAYQDDLFRSVQQYADSVKGRYDDVVVLGIGGSSLGGRAMLHALLPSHWNTFDSVRNGWPRYHFVENVDADELSGLMAALTPGKTLFNVITKSGTTAETMSAFMVAKQWLEDHLPSDQVATHIVATTDKAKGLLRPLALEQGYTTFEVPDDVGGRFSVFSAVGLLPAALVGVDIAALQRGLKAMDAVLQNPDVKANPAAQAALVNILLDERKGKSMQVFMPYSAKLSYVSDWFVQLWAESLGKKFTRDGKVIHAGQTPVKAVGVTDQHSQIQLFNEGPNNKVIAFLAVDAPNREVVIPNQFPELKALGYLHNQPMSRLMEAEFRGTRDSLTANQRPNLTYRMPCVDAEHLAQLLLLLEVQTALAGDLLGIDPFDQPGVEDAKKRTVAFMQADQREKSPVG
ncbi:MAG: glucose-6-phosphate isomerase [Candidatus Melainabacteria bacterium]